MEQASSTNPACLCPHCSLKLCESLVLRTTTVTFNPFKISLSNQGNQEGDSGRRYSRDSLEIHQYGPMESKKENNNNNNQKIQEYSGEIPEIPSGSPPPTSGIRKGNDNWRFRNIYPTDRFNRSFIKDLFPHGIKEKQECRRFRMRIQERDSRDRSRLEIFLPAVLCTSSLSGESMRRGAS